MQDPEIWGIQIRSVIEMTWVKLLSASRIGKSRTSDNKPKMNISSRDTSWAFELRYADYRYVMVLLGGWFIMDLGRVDWPILERYYLRRNIIFLCRNMACHRRINTFVAAIYAIL